MCPGIFIVFPEGAYGMVHRFGKSLINFWAIILALQQTVPKLDTSIDNS